MKNTSLPTEPKRSGGDIYVSDRVIWVLDESLVIVVVEEANTTHTLVGNEALFWGWLNAGLPISKCKQLLVELSGNSPDSASVELSNYIDHFTEIGLLKKGKQQT